MGYYILVEKDSRLMQKCWKWIIIVVLVLISITCFLSSYAFQAFLSNFNLNCVTGASVAFKEIQFKNVGLTDQAKQEADYSIRKINETSKEFRMYYMSREMRLQQIAETEEVPKTQIYQFLNGGPSMYRSTTERSSNSSGVTPIPIEDIHFFQNYQIDEINSRWGDSCSYFYYFPVIELTMAIVWIVFIMISGRRGEQRANMFIHKSWRLVVPAVLCFAIFAILCAVYAAYLNSRLNGFCKELKEKFTNEELPCTLLLNRFSLNDETAFNVAINFNLTKSIAYIRIFLWLLAGFIMLLRCILGADFECEEIEHRTEQDGAAFDADNDLPAKVKFIDDGIRRYERERVYKPTTEMQVIE